MKVLILAAGYGTRLYPLTINTSKALLPIKGKVLLNFIMDKIDNLKKFFPIEEVIIVSNERFYKDFLDWKKKFKFDVRVINDGTSSPENRKGAVGDIDFVIGKEVVESDWLVVGSDNFFDWGLSDFVHFSLDKRPAITVGVYDLKDKNKATRFGVVKLLDTMKVKDFVEKPKEPFSTCVAVCIYFLCKESLKYIRRFIEETKGVDAVGKYIEWMVKNYTVYGYEFEGNWLDVGHKDALELIERLV
ncbi:MAG: nucleotidyltransferase family protein [Candidatus Omnitrophica bacterium]|nr:nucleotidyltransferase family protein [Candidatus Omnitrophota bacterium]